jgi:arylsulfatase
MKIKTTILTVFLQIITLSIQSQVEKKPNVIIIVADDLGYSDIGCYGGEVETPALDNLANEGIRFSNMQNASMCVVSRTSLITGNWWTKAGKGITKGPNIAQELKKKGYRTGLVGKWHLNGEPNNKGFDYFFGFLGGYASYYKGFKSYRLNSEKFTDFGENYYSTKAFTERAIDFVSKTDASSKKPFFLYLSYQAPHNPLQAPMEAIMKYRGKYLKGWEAIRNERIKRQIKMGIIDKSTPIPDYPKNLPNWESLSDAQKDLEDLRMSVYAAMVDQMDAGIGKLIKVLKETKQADNTLIVFLSDNGSDSFSVMDKSLLKRGLLPGDVGSNFQPGTGWAYASVTPHRLYKISQHGGGVKTGAIVWWPNKIKEKGIIKSEHIHFVDIMPTILEATSNKKNKQSNSLINSLSGKSFLNLFESKNWKRKSPLFFQFQDNRAIRTAKWSLVEVDDNGWELYSNQNDPLETNDLSKIKKNVLKKLDKKWNQWWKKYNAGADYKPISTADSPHYKPQGDKGSGVTYKPSAMPKNLSHKYPIPQSKK